MFDAYLYRIINQAKRRKLAIAIVLCGIIGVLTSFARLDNIVQKYGNIHQETMLGLFSLIMVFAFDYAFAVGFRTGVLGYSLSDVNFHFASPFTPKSNLVISLLYGGASWLFFLWLITANAPLAAMWVGAGRSDVAFLLLEVFFTMLLVFMITSYISARFCSSIAKRIIPVIILLLGQFFAVIMVIRDLISEFGSFDGIREQSARTLIDRIGNSFWVDIFPLAGWNGLIYKGMIRGDQSIMPLVIGVYVLITFIVILLYVRTDFDYYEEAGANAKTIADIVEASKAGVEAVNTGIARTAQVGNEVLKRGWGASAFFHTHLFENKRASKLFFINKVALIYRAFGLLFLVIVDSIFEEIYDPVIIILGLVTMLVLNAIVFGGGKTVFEFNRPYLFMVPEKSWKKLAFCIAADVPEMIFDAFLCSLIIKVVAFNDYGVLSFILLMLLMISFDLLSETTGLICVRLFRNLGKFALMGIRYAVIIVFIIVGMVPATILTSTMRAETIEEVARIINLMIGTMGLTYFLIWVVLVFFGRNLIDNFDSN